MLLEWHLVFLPPPCYGLDSNASCFSGDSCSPEAPLIHVNGDPLLWVCCQMVANIMVGLHPKGPSFKGPLRPKLKGSQLKDDEPSL